MGNKKRTDQTSSLNQLNHQEGFFDKHPKSTGTFMKVPTMGNLPFIQAQRIRKRMFNYNKDPLRFLAKQKLPFKKVIIQLALDERLMDPLFIKILNILFFEKHPLNKGALSEIMSIQTESYIDTIFMYSCEKVYQAIKADDLLILGPGHPRLEFTEKMFNQGRKMMLIKQLGDSLDFMYHYMSTSGISRTEDRSRKQDLKCAYSLYLGLIADQDYMNLYRADEIRTKGFLFICASLFLTHETMTAEIVEQLIDRGGLTHKAVVPDPRIYYKVAKKTKAAVGSKRLEFLKTYIMKVIEVEKLPTV